MCIRDRFVTDAHRAGIDAGAKKVRNSVGEENSPRFSRANTELSVALVVEARRPRPTGFRPSTFIDYGPMSGDVMRRENGQSFSLKISHLWSPSARSRSVRAASARQRCLGSLNIVARKTECVG